MCLYTLLAAGDDDDDDDGSRDDDDESYTFPKLTFRSGCNMGGAIKE